MSGPDNLPAAAVRTPRARHVDLAGAGALTAVARGSGQIAQLAIMVTAARYLGPAEFGVFALVSALAYVLLRIAEAGWAEFVISSRDETAAGEAAMTISLIAGVLVGSLALGAAVAAYLLGVGRETVVLIALFAVWIVPTSVSSVQAGIMVRDRRVARLAVVQGLGEFLGLAVTLAALFLGHGLLSLIYGRLVQQCAVFGACLVMTGTLPGRLPDRALGAAMGTFYRNILAVRLFAVLRLYAATIIIGLFLGTASVGLYRAAERVIGAFGELVGEPLRMMCWMILRPVAKDAEPTPQAVRAAIAEAANQTFPLMIALAIPAFALVGLFAADIIVFLLGEQWRGAAPIASILAFARLLLVPAVATEVVLSLTGEVRRAPPVSIFNCAVAVILVLIMAQFDATAVAVGELLGCMVAFVTSIYLQSRFGGVNWLSVAKRSLFVLPALAVCVLVALASVTALAEFAMPAIVRAVLACGAALLAYAAIIAIIRPEAVRGGVGLVAPPLPVTAP